MKRTFRAATLGILAAAAVLALALAGSIAQASAAESSTAISDDLCC